jgi:hypothetical protein
MDSRIPGFYDEPRERRLELIVERCGLSTAARDALAAGDPYRAAVDLRSRR